MNPSMIRWKTVPSYSGSVVFCRDSGCVHSRRPSARSAKLATVFGAWSGNRFTRMSPWLVCRTALRAGAVDSVTTSTLPLRAGGAGATSALAGPAGEDAGGQQAGHGDPPLVSGPQVVGQSRRVDDQHHVVLDRDDDAGRRAVGLFAEALLGVGRAELRPLRVELGKRGVVRRGDGHREHQRAH